MAKWEIVKFRPRRSPLNDLTFNDVSVNAENVYYNLYKDEDKLGVVLFFLITHLVQPALTTCKALAVSLPLPLPAVAANHVG